MRHIDAYTKNQQARFVHKVSAAGCIGSFLTFFVGASLVPFLWSALLWVFHWLGMVIFGGPGPGLFHGWLDYVAAPNLRLGLFWLGYYIVSYLWASWTYSPRQKEDFESQLYKARIADTRWMVSEEQEEQQDDEGGDFLGLATAAPSGKRKRKPHLSRATPGDVKHQLVERCYEEYRKALKRYDPPPLDLKTPPTFYYGKGVKFGWSKDDLLPILPEELLEPSRIHLLLAPLAYHLARYNKDEPHPQALQHFPDYVPWPWLLILTGNFLWLPVVVKYSVEVPAYLNEIGEDMRERVYEALQFTCYLGQGQPWNTFTGGGRPNWRSEGWKISAFRRSPNGSATSKCSMERNASRCASSASRPWNRRW